MQTKFRNRNIYREAKVEMLKSYWDQILNWFVNEGIETGDAQIKQVGCNIMVVDKTVQDYVLRQLTVRIQILTNISGYVKRIFEKADVCQAEEVEKLIYSLQSYLIKSVEKQEDPRQAIPHEYQRRAYVSNETLERLDLGYKFQTNQKSCFIETFEEVGWLDPFPRIDPETGEIVLDTNEQSKNKYVTTKQLEAFALPSRAVMVQIMRACIGVAHPQDLWISKKIEK